ncbi:MAG: CopG family transcriptional regulator [Marinoscillum sp.]
MDKKKMLNVRLDDNTEKALKKYASEHDMTKSSVVKEALVAYLSKKENDQHPYALGADLFGAAASGSTDLSSTYKSRLKQKLNEKHLH